MQTHRSRKNAALIKNKFQSEPLPNIDNFCQPCIDRVTRKLANTRAETRWIPVSERLESGDYLGQSESGNWYRVRYFADGDANAQWYDLNNGNYITNRNIVVVQKITPYQPDEEQGERPQVKIV